MSDWVSNTLHLSMAAGLVAANGFFVAAEFALVKVRPAQIDELVRQKRPLARTARWLVQRMDGALAACQLGITMASLGLGWVGEPAFASLLEPALTAIGVESAAVLHTISFIIAFATITALHLVIGEQLPKIYALRRPERLALVCAPPLRMFYISTYPLMMGLSGATNFLLRRLGIEAGGHDTPHTEDEIRALLRQSHHHGELTGAEHRLIAGSTARKVWGDLAPRGRPRSSARAACLWSLHHSGRGRRSTESLRHAKTWRSGGS